MKKNRLLRGALAILLALSMLLPLAACTDGSTTPSDTTANGESTGDTTVGDTTADDTTVGDTTEADTSEDKVDAHTYDFYITLGTMPTLYATLNAYKRQNPNTYMWFLRGNTISHEYSADFIQYFGTQSQTNASSEVNWGLIRDKVKEILAADPEAKFHLYCDDLRVSFIPHIFVYAGVDFEDLRVTFLSDGTGTYNNYALMTDSYYAGYADTWASILETYKNGRNDAEFVPPYEDTAQSMQDLQYLAFYVSTFDNVDFWVQSPAYLLNDHAAVTAARESMHIVEKNPAEMYANLPDAVRADYQKVVLANALVDSDTLTTLEDAVAYFDSKLSNRDKEIVLILGTNKKTLDENKFYIDETLKFYTPTVSAEDATKVTYKGQTYTVESGAATVTVDGKELKIGELGVYLFFKGHPAHPADETLQGYFADHGIEILPHRTPVETLFWMYDVKVGGYQSTSFLSCYKGQTEFIYEMPDAEAIVQMMNVGFFEGCAIFEAPVEEEGTSAAS